MIFPSIQNLSLRSIQNIVYRFLFGRRENRFLFRKKRISDISLPHRSCLFVQTIIIVYQSFP